MSFTNRSMPPCSAPSSSESFHLVADEVVNDSGDAHAAQRSHQLGGLFDGLGAGVVGLLLAGAAAAAGADHRRAGLAQRRGDAPPCSARGAGDDRDLAAERVLVR
jgi:hypothetical protein